MMFFNSSKDKYELNKEACDSIKAIIGIQADLEKKKKLNGVYDFNRAIKLYEVYIPGITAKIDKEILKIVQKTGNLTDESFEFLNSYITSFIVDKAPICKEYKQSCKESQKNASQSGGKKSKKPVKKSVKK